MIEAVGSGVESAGSAEPRQCWIITVIMIFAQDRPAQDNVTPIDSS
jgi:hypothetical protein